MQQKHNILSEFRRTYELTYCGLPDDLVWVMCNLFVSQDSFDYGFVDKVYFEYRLWLFDNIHFHKIQFLAQQYLNLVVDSSGPACINMLNIFFNIFGAPKQIIPDNGSAFVSDERQLFS